MKIINRHEEDEMEFWHDYKEDDVRFPEHKEDQNDKVTVWNLNDK